MSEMRHYREWADGEHSRWVDAGNTFGRHLMNAARKYAFGCIPKSTDLKTTEIAQKAALDAIYGTMMLLDGVSDTKIDAEHQAEYVLHSRIRRTDTGEMLEEFELAPDGDGLCMGFHGWVAGGFG